jgi:hypothetical protein
MRRKTGIIALTILFALASVATMSVQPRATLAGEFGPDGYYRTVRVSAGGMPHLIPLDRIEHGGVQRDAIPPIDYPHYLTSERWNQLVYDDDRLVIGVEIDGFRRAYPFQVLIWHEIVNDTFRGMPLLVTY